MYATNLNLIHLLKLNLRVSSQVVNRQYILLATPEKGSLPEAKFGNAILNNACYTFLDD